MLQLTDYQLRELSDLTIQLDGLRKDYDAARGVTRDIEVDPIYAVMSLIDTEIFRIRREMKRMGK